MRIKNLLIEDVIDNTSDEIEKVNAVNELNNVTSDFEEGTNLVETVDTELTAGEEVIAAADAKAAETGEEPVIPVEDVVASQEALYNLIKLSGYEGITVVGNREDLYNNSYVTYKQNLEGIKEVGEFIMKGLKKLWEKIVEIFNWVVEKIKRLFPTKMNTIRYLLKELKSAPMVNGDDRLYGLNVGFTREYGAKNIAVRYIIGDNLELLSQYCDDMRQSIQAGIKLIPYIPQLATVESYEQIKQVSDSIENVTLNDNIKNRLYYTKLKAGLDDMGEGSSTFSPSLIAVSGRDNILNGTFSLYDGVDGSRRNVKVSVTLDSKNNEVAFNKNKTISCLEAFIKAEEAINKDIIAFNAELKKEVNRIRTNESIGGLSDILFRKRQLNKKLRSDVLDRINMITNFDSSITTYVLVYAKELLAFIKNNADMVSEVKTVTAGPLDSDKSNETREPAVEDGSMLSGAMSKFRNGLKQVKNERQDAFDKEHEKFLKEMGLTEDEYQAKLKVHNQIFES